MATRGLVLLAKDTFSAASSVQFDNVFSNTYKQYKIIFNETNNITYARLVTSGTPNTGSIYLRQRIEASSTSVSGARATETSWTEISGSYATTIFEILNPFQSTYTSAISLSAYSVTSNIVLNTRAFGTTGTTSFDGIYFFPPSGTITGTITIYGLAE